MIRDLILSIVLFVIWILVLKRVLGPIKYPMGKNKLNEIKISLSEILKEQEEDLNTLEDYVVMMQVNYLQRPYFYECKNKLQDFIFHISHNIDHGQVEKAKEQMVELEYELNKFWNEILESSELEY